MDTKEQQATVTISLQIENMYELYENVTTVKTNEVIPAPPAIRVGDEYDEWADEHIYAFTGVGHEDGNSAYEVTVTACSDPTLVGAVFEFGY